MAIVARLSGEKLEKGVQRAVQFHQHRSHPHFSVKAVVDGSVLQGIASEIEKLPKTIELRILEEKVEEILDNHLPTRPIYISGKRLAGSIRAS